MVDKIQEPVLTRAISMRILLLIFCTLGVFVAHVQAQPAHPRLVDFTKADSMAALYPLHPLHNLKVLSDKLTAPLPTPTEKFRAIYKWVCNNIANDYTLYTLNKGKREKLSGESLRAWDKKFRPRVLNVLRETHGTVCTGYAYLVREMAFHAGINCKIVDGYGRTVQSNIGGKGIPNHSWNAVELGGTWYLCDPTWSSGALYVNEQRFVRKYENAYFLADPALFVRNHYPLDPSWMLLDDKPALDTFLNSPLVYANAFRYGAHPQLPATFDVAIGRGETVSFQFITRGGQAAREVALQVEDQRTTDKAGTQVYPDGSVRYSLNHLFARKGAYAVHVLLDGAPAFTYRVQVK